MTRTVLITGATSGFGAATARRFAKSGWRVVANGRRAERLESLVHELGTDTVTAAVFDVRDAAAIDAALARLPKPFKGVDVLVNNAGLALGTAPAPQAKLDDWLTVIQTNVVGLVTITSSCCRRLSSAMARSSTSAQPRAVTRTRAATCTARPRRSSVSSRWTCAATFMERANVDRLELLPVSQSWAGFEVYRNPAA